MAGDGRLAEGLFAAPSPNLPEKDMEALKDQMRDCLEARGGEVSARARAANLGRIYLSLNAKGRKRFLQILAREFDIDHQAVNKAVTALQKAGTTMTSAPRPSGRCAKPCIRHGCDC
ncbi:MAG: hypothetical protein R3F44_02840 [Candidatus Competibacteraceae bacterium]